MTSEKNNIPRATRYMPIIGLEVHVELKTESKMFCGCSADYFGKEANSHTCPVCLGLPGALPVANTKAIDWCLMIALALNCKINTFSKFDRKNYFYPDLSKGYQISQYDLPFGYEGSMTLSNGKTIRIRRVHMEEDTGKLTHDNKNDVSLIDFNRSGVPLVEIVTEPDFSDASEVKEYLQKLQQIVRYLNVSNADMEKGDMRLEPNISLTDNEKIDYDDLPKYKVEVKNINSFRFVEKAINFEIDRQSKILETGKLPLQETRGWSESKNETISQRLKEEANDYRYFPEPDLPPIKRSENEISTLRSSMPELPDAKFSRFLHEFSLNNYDVEILTRDTGTADYFEEAVKLGKSKDIKPKQIANFLINKKPDISTTSPIELINQIASNTQTDDIDENELDGIIQRVLTENVKAVSDYKNGKETVIMFLLGQVMRAVGKKVDAQLVKQHLQKKLS